MNKEIELVDLVDKTGSVQKRGVERTEIDVYPDLHLQIVVGVIVNKKGEMLVQRRSLTKRVNPGDIDHVCGGIHADETPEMACERETVEETGVRPTMLKIITEGVNKYNRYRYLLVGEADEKPFVVDPNEVEWVGYIPIDTLKEKNESGEYTFVDEFFEDTELALFHYKDE